MAAIIRALMPGWSAAGPDMTMKATEHELKSLLMDHLAGDPEAYRAFLEKVSVLLRQFVGRRLFRLRRSEQDVEDIVQETLIAIHARRHTYDGETPVTAWVYAIARYKLIDNLRLSPCQSDLASLDEMDGAIDDSGQTEARLAVQKMLSLLPEKLRVPLELMKLQGLSASEAARQTGTSEVTVRVNVHRGLKALGRFTGRKGE